MELYSATKGKEVNILKSTISFTCFQDEEETQFPNIFPFKCIGFNNGFKYLGFPLKPNGREKTMGVAGGKN